MLFFFKPKAAYEMRISDWSSDVCSSDLCDEQDEARRRAGRSVLGLVDVADRGQTRRHQDPSADPARTGGSGPGRRAPGAVAGREHERAAGEADRKSVG